MGKGELGRIIKLLLDKSENVGGDIVAQIKEYSKSNVALMKELRLIEIKTWLERYDKTDVYSGHEENWATVVAATCKSSGVSTSSDNHVIHREYKRRIYYV